MPAHRTSRWVSVFRFDDRFTGLDAPVRVADAASPFSPFGPFRAQHRVSGAALPVKPPTVETPLPLAQPFRRFGLRHSAGVVHRHIRHLAPAQENTP